MTTGVIITIVLGLLVLVISIYIFMGKTRLASAATTCEPEQCITSVEMTGCPSGMVKGFTPCSEKDEATGKTHTGRCCVQEDPVE